MHTLTVKIPIEPGCSGVQPIRVSVSGSHSPPLSGRHGSIELEERQYAVHKAHNEADDADHYN